MNQWTSRQAMTKLSNLASSSKNSHTIQAEAHEHFHKNQVSTATERHSCGHERCARSRPGKTEDATAQGGIDPSILTGQRVKSGRRSSGVLRRRISEKKVQSGQAEANESSSKSCTSKLQQMREPSTDGSICLVPPVEHYCLCYAYRDP